MKTRRLLGLSVVLCSCQGQAFDHLEYDHPDDAFGPHRITVVTGSLDSARVTAIDTSGERLQCDVALVSRDRNVMVLEKDYAGATVVFALSNGVTIVDVSCDGDIVGKVDGVVTDPPPL